MPEDRVQYILSMAARYLPERVRGRFASFARPVKGVGMASKLRKPAAKLFGGIAGRRLAATAPRSPFLPQPQYAAPTAGIPPGGLATQDRNRHRSPGLREAAGGRTESTHLGTGAPGSLGRGRGRGKMGAGRGVIKGKGKGKMGESRGRGGAKAEGRAL